MTNRPLITVAILLACATPAVAGDYTEVSPVRPLTMSDPSGLSVVALEFQWTKWTVDPSPQRDATSLSFDAAVDYTISPHWVLLARIPFDKASIDAGDCCDLALGNITLGGRGLWSFGQANSVRTVVGGELTIALPTASDGTKTAPSSGAAALSQLTHDPSLYAPSVNTVVTFTGISQLYSRWWLLNVQLGVGLWFFDGDLPGSDHFDIAARTAVGAGFRVNYAIALLAELSARWSSDNLLVPGNDTVSSLDLGVRYAGARVIASARLFLPLDPQLRDIDMLGIGADLGFRF